MENQSILILISISIPMIFMCGILKGRSRRLVVFMLLGVISAILSGGINTFFFEQSNNSRFYLTINISPAVEEIIKALPIFVFAFWLRPDRQSLLDSAVATGLGFAMYENIYLLLQSQKLSMSLAILRGLGAGLMHSICTLAVAFGVSFLVKHKGWFVSGSVALLTVSMNFHALYNILIQSRYMFLGVLLPLCAYIPILAINAKKHTDKEILK